MICVEEAMESKSAKQLKAYQYLVNMWTTWEMLLGPKIIHIAAPTTQGREINRIFLREIKARTNKILHLDFNNNFYPKRRSPAWKIF